MTRSTTSPSNAVRFVVCVLTILLAGLLVAAFNAPVAWQTRLLIGAGLLAGAAYAIYGRNPGWIQRLFADSLAEDNDERNLSPRVYLPLILAAIVAAAIAIWLATR